jgi:hypothetical protein
MRTKGGPSDAPESKPARTNQHRRRRMMVRESSPGSGKGRMNFLRLPPRAPAVFLRHGLRRGPPAAKCVSGRRARPGSCTASHPTWISSISEGKRTTGSHMGCGRRVPSRTATDGLDWLLLLPGRIDRPVYFAADFILSLAGSSSELFSDYHSPNLFQNSIPST